MAGCCSRTLLRARCHRRGLKPAATTPWRLLSRLRREYPEARCALNFRNDFELALAVILSAQTTDVSVNRVTPALFARYPDADALAHARVPEVAGIIRALGLHRAKAKNIIGAAQVLNRDFAGRVPATHDELRRLPGVGRKTANVILNVAFGLPAVAVDTHVARVSRRLGWTRAAAPEGVERDLMALLPRRAWAAVNHLLIAHGRACCRARAPRCPACPLLACCPWPGRRQPGGLAADAAKRKPRRQAGGVKRVSP